MAELLEQVREAIESSGQSLYAISKATGIGQSQLGKVRAGTAGLSFEAAERLLNHLGYEIQVKKKRKGK
ncbi:MAG: hypothetical protein ABGZ35_26175 [Planctomycetaceae bacterium]